MSVQVYLRWDGMTDSDRAKQTYHTTGPECGEAGFLHDFNRPNYSQLLVPEAYSADEAYIPSGLIHSRLGSALRRIEEYNDTYQDHDSHYYTMIFHFILRLAQLEAAGLNPKVTVR